MDLLIVMILIYGQCMGFAAGIKNQKITSGILPSTIATFIRGVIGMTTYSPAHMFGALLGTAGAE
jgi:hypothetical protein